MQFNRRRFLGASAGALALSTTMSFGQPAFPSGTVTFVCAFPAGSGADVIVRFFAQRLTEITKATIIVENRPGAAGNLAAQYVVRSKPDGHTLYVHGGNTVAANMHLFKNPPFDAVKDLRVAATINKQPYMMMVAADSPVKNVTELTASIKAKGEAANYAVSNTASRVIGALYKRAAGLQSTEVSYAGAADSLNDTLSGRIDYAIHDPAFASAQAREGRLRILAVSTAERMKSLPDIPTMVEEGVPGINVFGWWAAMLPAGTPDEQINSWNAWFNEALALEETQKFLNGFGSDVFVMSPAEGQAFMKQSVDEWEEYVRLAGIPKN